MEMSHSYSFLSLSLSLSLDDTGSKVMCRVPLWNLDKILHTLSSLLPLHSHSTMIAAGNHERMYNQRLQLQFLAPDDERWEIPLNHDSCRQPQTYVKPEATITVFGLLMMSGVLPETC